MNGDHENSFEVSLDWKDMIPEMDPTTDIAFSFIKEKMDEDKEE